MTRNNLGTLTSLATWSVAFCASCAAVAIWSTCWISAASGTVGGSASAMAAISSCVGCSEARRWASTSAKVSPSRKVAAGARGTSISLAACCRWEPRWLIALAETVSMAPERKRSIWVRSKRTSTILAATTATQSLRSLS